MDVHYMSVRALLRVSLGLLLSLSAVSQAEGLPADSSTGSSAIEGSEEVACPAVCPACPGCPACPSAPFCFRYTSPGYEYYGGLGYYKMHYEERNWLDAKAACEREGAELVVINSQAEADLATSLMDKYNATNYLLVGFLDLTNKGKYITVFGDELSSTGFSNFDRGEPNNVGWENCGSFVRGGLLNDMNCAETWPFLCEL